MLRVLLALLALVSPAFAFVGEDAVPAQEHASAAPWTALDYTLPGPDGWVSFALTATSDALLDLRFTSPGADPGETHHADMILTSSEGDVGGMSAGSASASDFARVNVDGMSVGCCTGDAFAPLVGRGGTGNGSIEGMTILAGDTVWVTLVAAHADPAIPPVVELRVVEGAVEVAERREGTSVSLLDLDEDARANGRNVQLDTIRLGVPGVSDHAWTADANGVVLLTAWADGDASARLSAVAAGETHAQDVEVLSGEPSFLFAMGPGEYRVRLSDLDEPVTLPTADERHVIDAMVLFAELDVPGAGARWHGPE